MFETFLSGIVISALIGLATGWVRYWMGFFVLFQGVIASLLIVWLIGKYRKHGSPVPSPSNRTALMAALGWLITFWVAQIYGLGLAQPWFDPFGYFGRILQGDAKEMAFGIKAIAGWARGFGGGFGGGFWVFLNVLDSAIMYLFLFRLPWPARAGNAPPEAGAGTTAENPTGGES
ncbi:MAG: hypothetical protein ABSA59_01290 [Terriglobia bacterium]|jgi:hypothetical protein